jgi:hypothetical protein
MSQPGPFTPPTPNPFQAPNALPKPAAAAAGLAQMEYLRSFQYIFENPNWLMNLLWSFLCQLAGQVIPILPAMVFMGYQFEAVEELHASRGARYPDFDVNRLMDYLSRGIWPVLVLLMFAFGFVIVFLGVLVGTMVCTGAMGAAGGDDAAPVLVPVGLALGSILGLVVVVALAIYSTPMILRAGLAQDLGAAFDFAWVSDFARKMWVETVLSALFLTVSVVALVLLTCGLAGIVLGPMMPFVSTHLYYQLYSIYLSRGGTPVPLKPRMAVPPGYAPPQQY